MANRGHGRNGNRRRDDSRNSRSVALVEGGNRSTNFGPIQEQIKSSVSSHVWPNRNYSEIKCLDWGRRNRHFYDEYENKAWPYTKMLTIRMGGFGII